MLMLAMVPIAVVFAAVRVSLWLGVFALVQFLFALPRTKAVLAKLQERRGSCSNDDVAIVYLGSVWRVLLVTIAFVASFGLPFLAGLMVAGLIWQIWSGVMAVFVATALGIVASVGFGPMLSCRILVWLFENYWDLPIEESRASRHQESNVTPEAPRTLGGLPRQEASHLDTAAAARTGE